MRSGEIGGIQVTGPNVFKGYWRMPEKTADEFTTDLWFKTGDVGTIDADGYVTIIGRSKDLVISGGYNVYPAEIEGFINEMPGVAESAVIGVPHADFGEAVVAVVVAKAGASLDADALIAALKSKIANFKVPKQLFVVDELPRNAMGKVRSRSRCPTRSRHRSASWSSSTACRTMPPIDKLYDNLDRMRGVEVYLNNQGAASLNAMRTGNASIGANASNKVTITEQLLKPESLYLTGNTSTLYAADLPRPEGRRSAGRRTAAGHARLPR